MNCKEKEIEEEHEDLRLFTMYGLYLKLDSNKLEKMFIRQSAKFNTEWVLISVAIMGLSPYILETHTEKCIDKMIHLGFASK